MKFIELLNHADPDLDYMQTCIDPKTGDFIEGKVHPLTAAIVLELRETFNPEAPDEDQLEIAIATMLLAIDNIEDVIYGLEEILNKAPLPAGKEER